MITRDAGAEERQDQRAEPLRAGLCFFRGGGRYRLRFDFDFGIAWGW